MGTSAGHPLRFGEGGFRAGDHIGPRYTILRLLGAGGMGAVYQAFDHELGVGVAIKVIRPGAQTDATAARDLEQRFKRELVLARQITHKNVVRIHDIGNIDGVKYLTMPFIDGQTLADVLRTEGKLPVARALAMAKHVAQGLAAAHDKGVVHRDLKPENIMIEKGEPPQGGEALIMDFGIARSVERGNTQTAAGSVIGTIEYMAPEQGRGETVDQRADIYSFGLIVYDALLGRQRLKSGENAMSELLGRFQKAPPPPRSINGEVPEALDRIVSKCLEPSAQNRYQTTHEVVAALEALTIDGHSRLEASQTSAPPVEPSQTPATLAARPPAFDPDATFAGGPDKTFAADLDVTFAGAPATASSRPKADDVATIGPTAPGPDGTHKGPIEVGQQFGTRYHIIRELGVGGMGAVYQAWDAELGVSVALKIIRPEIAANPEASAEIERRFKRELLLARQITHPNVVRIHDLGDINGIKYITMPFIEGSDLSTILDEQKKLPVPRALHIARGVVAGLVSAHEAGVVHRDLKPANIMIGADDVPTIMDFGIARAADSPQASVTPHGVRPSDFSRTAGLTASTTQSGAIVGTVAYMAPEQATGKPVDQRADIYAFGLILYDMLIGGRRREHAQSAVAELVERMQTAPPAPRTIDETIPEAIDAIVRRCLEPDPENRFKKTADLHAAFERLDDEGKPLPMIRRLTRRGMALSAAAVLLLVVGTFFGAQWLFAPPPVHDPISVLVANFNNQTGDAAFDGALEQMVHLGVEGTSFITSYPRQAAQGLATEIVPGSTLDEERARLVAIREGVKVVLAGRIETDGAGYRLSMRAIDPATNESLATLEGRAASKDKVIEAVSNIATDLRRALGDVDAENILLEETFTAGSLEAARTFALGEGLLASGRSEDALARFQEAIAADPNFGRAYAGMGNATFRLGRIEESAAFFQKALALMERMSEREKLRTLGSYYLGPGANYEQAITNFQSLGEKYPADGAGLSNLAVAYFQTLDFKKAEAQGERAVAIYPNNQTSRTNLALYAMYATDFERATSEAKSVIAKGPRDLAYLPIAIAAIDAGKPDEARIAYEDMAKTGVRGASTASMGRADMAMYYGRYAEAIAELKIGAAADADGKQTRRQAVKLVALADAALMTGAPASAIPLLKQALALSTSESVTVPAGRALAALGVTDQAADLASALEKQVQKRRRAFAAVIRAELALKQGKPIEAIDALTASRQLADVWLVRFVLGRAYLEAGSFAEAVAELQECVNRRGEAGAVFLDDVPTYRYLPPVYYWLARAQEGLGIADAATKNYQTYLALHGNAERDPLVIDARKRTAR
jgi:serine/threonine protein kinase/tetratricopeptide (TPR) repeat protein